MKAMGMNREFIFRAALLPMLLFLTGCAEIRLNTLPEPARTAKLRVFVLPVSGTLPRGTWKTPHAEFAQNSYLTTLRMLNEKGIYTIVSTAEVQKVTGGQEIHGWQWEKNEWEWAKKAGRALHADYLFIPMRGHSGFFYAKLVMINLETGALYEKLDHAANMRNPDDQSREQSAIFRECYREIFRRAKGDMLATAIRKGRLTPPAASGSPAREAAEKKPDEASEVSAGGAPRQTPIAAPEKRPQPAGSPLPGGALTAPEEKPAGTAGMKKPEPPKPAAAVPVPHAVADAGESRDRRAIRSGPAEERQTLKAGADGKTSAGQRMIVYDLQTTAQLNIVSLILSEALREELFALGGFDLINREDMGQAIQEMKLQQSGLIDDSQALQIGKWLAANQTITGSLGIIGDAMILQTKRTDLQTMRILARGSILAGVGKEQELLDGLQALARKLIAR